ncbi:uncharacterized protein LOC121964896 isoform X3 [Plectropomus leopardus]|uniref:uncharacterized protein LOC121964896 isoform X3 n=1 Tax=Plectropomus leopardus TaxID=160734 RepID=UPI001C4C10F4|nr:uncharacterized protein LOC121964896 isoform X3 [Plectropomus leopardus]
MTLTSRMQRWSAGNLAVELLQYSRELSMKRWRLQCGPKSSTVKAMSLLSWTVEAQIETPAHLAKLSASPAQILQEISDLLTQPNISSFSTDGVSRAKQQGFQVLEGSNFTITCSIKPHFPGGSFTLTFTTSNTAQNYTLPAVNHYTHFLFSAADHTHRGEYRCVYRIYFFGLNFSSESQPLHLTIGGNFTKNQTQKSDTDSLNILTLQE